VIIKTLTALPSVMAGFALFIALCFIVEFFKGEKK